MLNTQDTKKTGVTQKNSLRADRYAWLFSPDCSIPVGSPDNEEIEFVSELLQRCWQVSPAVLPRFLNWIPAHAHSLPCLEAIKARAIGVQYLAKVQVLLWKRITLLLTQQGIPHVLLKSGALRYTIYDDLFSRSGGDIDFGVPSLHLADCRLALESLGFVAAQGDDYARRFRPADPVRRASVEADHYELGFYVRRQIIADMPEDVEAAIRSQLHRVPNPWHITPSGDLACYAILDVHHGISREIQVDPIVASSVQIAMDSVRFSIPRPAWAMFHLIFKIYWEGVHKYGIGAYQYADVCRLLHCMDAKEMEALKTLLSEWQLTAAGYFVLRRIETDFNMKLPAEMAQFVAEAAYPDNLLDPISQNDLGDMWYKIWGLR